MASIHEGYEFLEPLHPFDRITWWIGAVARESAQLELTCALIATALQQQGKTRVTAEKDKTLGHAIRELKKLCVRCDIRSVAPSSADEILAWASGLEPLSNRRNRTMHDVVAWSRDGHIAFGSADALSDAGRPVTESDLATLRRDIERVTRRGEDLWSRADQEWRPRV